MPHKQAWNGVEDQYRLLARSIQDLAIFLLDPQGMVTSWNPGAEQFFGYREEEALGMPFSGLFTAEDIEQGVPEQELQTAQGKGRVSGNRWLIRKDGTCLWVKGTTTSLRDEEGHLRGFAKICHDLTERKRLEEALRNADRRKDEFLAMLAHELRDPLAPIRNSVQVLRQPGTAEADVQRSLDLIDRQVRHLNRLVDDLLDVSRISRGQLRLQKRPVELPTVVAQAVETCRPLIDAQHHQLHVDIHPVLQVRADPTRLTQVLVNLLTNAARYTPEGGHLRLALEQSGPEVVVRVKDDGIGIRPEMLPHIFDLYNQAAPEWHHSQGGLGIGLTLVKRLVELHGGRVEAFSDGPGRGAEFVVQLPHLQEIPIGETRPEASAPLPSRRVLVIEDSLDTAESTAMVLRLAGHEVRVVREAAAALEAAQEFQPEVVLLDLGLPGSMTGLDLAPQLRQVPGLETALLVALTGYGQEEDKRLSRDAGFDAHLTKPTDPKVLLELLARGTA